MGSVALDASAVIAVFSGGDAHHDSAVAELSAALDLKHSLSIAVSAYSEVMVHAMRERRGDHLDSFFARLGVELVEIDRSVGRLAAVLRGQHRGLRLPDALVLAAARSRGARLLTFDKNLARLAADAAQS